MTSRTRILLWGAAAMLAAAALLPAVAHGAAPSRAAAVDLNAPVKSGSQCMPCHADIGAAKKPGLIFSHASHIVYGCEGCHTAPAHTGGVSIAPDMASCFNCHGLKHRGKTIARAECEACHTKSWKRRPADHSADWKLKPHAASAKGSANRCLMCHDAKACEDCHAKTAPTAPKTQPEYLPILKGTPRRPAVKVYPDGLVTMGQCVNCHPDLDRFMPGRVIFAHATHLQRAFACKDCHRSFAHGPDTTTRPDMPSCYQCHGLTHASRGLVATDKCADCHPKGFILKPADHTSAFVKSGHKKNANLAPEQCAMCHQPKFCSDCHQGKPATPGGPARQKVIPLDHRSPTFRKLHGKNYLDQKGACGSCHESKFCEGCHKTPMPHPADWTASHAIARGLDSADCNVCHTDRGTCQDCHHNQLRGAKLLRENCVNCHPSAAIIPPTSIKDKGIAEHAVHFDVAKTKKREPYVCEDCHVGFKPAVARGTVVIGRGHDLRLCYDCHGALDYKNEQIAPYPGNSLCIRCHKNINF